MAYPDSHLRHGRTFDFLLRLLNQTCRGTHRWTLLTFFDLPGVDLIPGRGSLHEGWRPLLYVAVKIVNLYPSAEQSRELYHRTARERTPAATPASILPQVAENPAM